MCLEAKLLHTIPSDARAASTPITTRQYKQHWRVSKHAK